MRQGEYIEVSGTLKVKRDWFLKFVNRSFMRHTPFEDIRYVKDLDGETVEILVKNQNNTETFGVRCLTREEMSNLRVTNLIDIGSRMKQKNIIFICRQDVFKCKSPVTSIRVEIEEKEIQICVVEMLKDEKLEKEMIVYE